MRRRHNTGPNTSELTRDNTAGSKHNIGIIYNKQPASMSSSTTTTTAQQQPNPTPAATTTAIATTTTTTNSELFHGPAATLSTACSRALGDRSYDKRKSGALEVESVIKALIAEQKRNPSASSAADEGVGKVVRRLANDFIVSTNSNQRKGGLIGLAAVAIGLGSEVGRHLDLLLPPVLKCFDDPEARVRYYAAESLFNVVKVARGALLVKSAHFNAVFHGLCKAFADSDAEVKNGATLLDRLLKDVVSECSGFDTAGVIPLFQEYFKVKNPFIRQLLISWVAALDAVPDLDVTTKTPLLLDGLLDMLSDNNKSIRDSAELVLQNLKEQLLAKSTEYVKEIQQCVDILVQRKGEAATRLLVLVWVRDFLSSPVGDASLVDRLADLLAVVVRAQAEADEDIKEAAKRLDGELRRVATGEQGVHMLEGPILTNCLHDLSSEHRSVRELALGWISLLLDVLPTSRTLPFQEQVVPRLLDTMRTDPLDEVVVMALAALARFVKISNKFETVLADVCALFAKDKDLLENRGALIIRQLCLLLTPTTVYLVLAKTVDTVHGQDVDFAALLVHALNVILLTAPELMETRVVLRRAWMNVASEVKNEGKTMMKWAGTSSNSTNNDDMETFTLLFHAWCHNAISCLSLCLLGGAYGLGAKLVEFMGTDVEPTVGMLVDADRLVRLLETPAFLHVRMQLLRSGSNFEPDLLKSLYGLLMLLPQKSDAYSTLHARLASVTNMHIALGGTTTNTTSTTRPETKFDELLREFQRVQVAHGKARSIHHKSL